MTTTPDPYGHDADYAIARLAPPMVRLVDDTTTDVGDITVTVNPTDDGHGYTLATSGPDHGITWEHEDPRSWPTPLEAMLNGVADAAARITTDAAADIDHDDPNISA